MQRTLQRCPSTEQDAVFVPQTPVFRFEARCCQSQILPLSPRPVGCLRYVPSSFRTYHPLLKQGAAWPSVLLKLLVSPRSTACTTSYYESRCVVGHGCLKCAYKGAGCSIHREFEKGRSRKPVCSLAHPYTLGPVQGPLSAPLSTERLHKILWVPNKDARMALYSRGLVF